MRLFAQRAQSGFQTRRRVRQLLVGGLLALSATLFPASIAGAATGDVLRTVVAANPNFCGLNTGVAFDGTNLLETCDANNNINVVSTADGSLVRTVTVPGVSGIGAAAWDAAAMRRSAGVSTSFTCCNERDSFCIAAPRPRAWIRTPSNRRSGQRGCAGEGA